ncbi:MAG: hypothetical protein LIO79_05020 [Rikenellaceae bacterium]|nr:hypothetical protein [Rikenellaceae bacterium]
MEEIEDKKQQTEIKVDNDKIINTLNQMSERLDNVECGEEQNATPQTDIKKPL